ncbi:MAG: phosphate ABC transporter substrate-binding protein [Eubacteriaceae bacterium]|jgi:phosphate transport system substrate-binding protein|nr:phosphate ABC transporter substrate-binding protein [Eubacteriaceae bacterium]
MMKMKSNAKKYLKVFAAVMFCTLVAAGASGCAGAGTEVKIVGSTSVQPLSRELAKGFMENNRSVDVIVDSSDSEKAIEAVESGTADIGAVSRKLENGENANVGKVYTIAIDGVAVIVNKDVKVDDLSLQQLKDIYTGKITNWKQVGGEDAAITLVSREPGSGTREAFVEKTGVMDNSEDMTSDGAIVCTSTYKAVKTVSEKKYSIGYAAFESAGSSVKTIKVGGVLPTEDTVRNGTYPIQRPFQYVTGKEVSEQAQAYLDYVMSRDAQSRIKERGYVTSE